MGFRRFFRAACGSFAYDGIRIEPHGFAQALAAHWSATDVPPEGPCAARSPRQLTHGNEYFNLPYFFYIIHHAQRRAQTSN